MDKKMVKYWERDFAQHEKKARNNNYESILDYLDVNWCPGKKFYEILKPYITPNSVILEIGCGLGRISRWVISNSFGQLYLTDISEVILRKAKKILKNRKNVFFERITGEGPSIFKKHKFDIVFSFGTFFHFDIQQVYNYFTEIHRVLKSGGICIIEFKDLTDNAIFKDFLELCRTYQNCTRNPVAFRYVDFAIIRKLSSNIGFKIIKYTPYITILRKG